MQTAARLDAHTGPLHPKDMSHLPVWHREVVATGTHDVFEAR
jgi:hypothetical protein